jgi:Leucine-rich repeat (LRR) protein
MTRLKVLNVSNNRFSTLPMAELAALPLTQLHASKNSLSGTLFPQPTAVMPRLQQLDVSINALSALTAARLALPELRELNVAFNRIPRLPDDLAAWRELRSLIAEDNRLSELPPGFAGLAALRLVDFTGNDFSRLDPRIGAMAALETIKLAANPIRERKFLTMGTAEVKRDLRARMGADDLVDEVD